MRRCVQAIEAERKVLIAFRLNDMKADAYLRTKGERAGEPAASLESKLIHIGLIKIDGQQVFPAAAPAPVSEDAAATEDADTADGTVEAPTAESVQDEPVPAPEAEEPALAASF